MSLPQPGLFLLSVSSGQNQGGMDSDMSLGRQPHHPGTFGVFPPLRCPPYEEARITQDLGLRAPG